MGTIPECPLFLMSHGACSPTPRLPWALSSWQGWVGEAAQLLGLLPPAYPTGSEPRAGTLPSTWEPAGALRGRLRASWQESLMFWKLSGWVPRWLPRSLSFQSSL